jgi:hypothetical protein
VCVPCSRRPRVRWVRLFVFNTAPLILSPVPRSDLSDATKEPPLARHTVICWPSHFNNHIICRYIRRHGRDTRSERGAPSVAEGICLGRARGRLCTHSVEFLTHCACLHRHHWSDGRSRVGTRVVSAPTAPTRTRATVPWQSRGLLKPRRNATPMPWPVADSTGAEALRQEKCTMP